MGGAKLTVVESTAALMTDPVPSETTTSVDTGTLAERELAITDWLGVAVCTDTAGALEIADGVET